MSVVSSSSSSSNNSGSGSSSNEPCDTCGPGPVFDCDSEDSKGLHEAAVAETATAGASGDTGDEGNHPDNDSGSAGDHMDYSPASLELDTELREERPTDGFCLQSAVCICWKIYMLTADA